MRITIVQRVTELCVVVAVFLLSLSSTVSVPARTQSPVESQDAIPGIAIWHGNVYVSDTQTDRIFVKAPGETEFRPSDIIVPGMAPRGLAADDNSLYIATPSAHQVFRVDKNSKEITPLLPKNSPIIPIDIASSPTFLEGPEPTRLSGLAILDGSTRSILKLKSFIGRNLLGSFATHQFVQPRSISMLDEQILVSDYSAVYGTYGTKDWTDISAHAGVGGPPFYQGLDIQVQIESIKRPESAVRFRDFIYYIDASDPRNHKLYAFLPAKDRLIPLAFKNSPPTSPDRAIPNEDADELLLVGASIKDFRTWPLLLPMTVEVAVGADASAPLAAMYSYLWKRGFLPEHDVLLPRPWNTCIRKMECLIEYFYPLVPQANTVMKQLLCDMNPDFCKDNKWQWHKLKYHKTRVNVPDVPLEDFLVPEPTMCDGRTKIWGDLGHIGYLQRGISDTHLWDTVRPDYVKVLNPQYDITENFVCAKGATLILPVQHFRYFLSIARSELFQRDSGLADLIKQYPSLIIKPYGATSRSSARSLEQAAMPQAPVLDPSITRLAHQDMLDHIGFDSGHSSLYGRAGNVPILVDETALDCQHPVFFGSAQVDHAFAGTNCSSPETAPSPGYLVWSESDLHHGTCVASIIGGRTAPYGAGLAPGAELTLIDSVNVDIDLLIRFYQRVRQSFIVNVSAGTDALPAANSWRYLFRQPLVKGNVLVVAAADNDNDLLSNRQKMPAFLAREFPNVVSVGALNRQGTDVWRNQNGQGSNTGNDVEILAPGEEVPCAMEVSQGQAVYTNAPGTSFATPIVTAVAALLLQKRLSPAEVKARLLATADPIDIQRLNQPLALFGTLNVDYALSDFKASHLQFSQQGTLTRLDGDILAQSRLSYEDLARPIRIATPVATDDILSIRSAGRNGNEDVYRLVWFNAPDFRVEVARVLLDGCLIVQSRQTQERYVFSFRGSCPEAGQSDQDQNKVINALQLLVAPTLGAVRFQ